MLNVEDGSFPKEARSLLVSLVVQVHRCEYSMYSVDMALTWV